MENLKVFVFFVIACISNVTGIDLRYLKDRAICEIDGVSSMENLRDLSDMNFTSTSVKFKPVCYRVRFTNSRFEEFPENFFDKLKSNDVKEVVAKNVGLQMIKPEDFKMAENLLNLRLSSNQIEALHEKNFMNLESLRFLDLSSNLIRNVHNDAFLGLTGNFTKIDLSKNKLLSFKEKFLMEMSKSAEGPEVLLNNNEIYMVEPVNFLEIYGAKKRKIKLLDLSSNKLKVFGLPSLNFTTLRLNNNMIEKMILPEVKDLEINDNRMQELFIGRNVVSLSASNNRISEIQCDDNLKIEKLRLSGNNIFSDIFNCLKFSRNLRTLDLSHNPLGVLTVDSFAEATELEELNLADTDIKRLSYGVLGHQYNLRFLDISDNNLGKIDYFVLASLRNLEMINISGNKLKEFHGYKKLKEISKNIDTIGLENNNWKCEYLAKMWLRFNKNKITVLDAKIPMKTQSNIGGIKCTSKSDKEEQEKKKNKGK